MLISACYVSEAAQLAGISSTTLKRWLAVGKIGGVARNHKGWLVFTPEDIERIKRFASARSVQGARRRAKTIASPASEALPLPITAPNAKTDAWLIESFFPTMALSEEGAAERYQHGKTPHTITTWWARRPFAAVRGIMATALMKDSQCTSHMRPAIEEYCSNPGSLWAQASIKESISFDTLHVLDAFAGGATFPLEAAALGAQAYALDNNELAHFIQLTLLQFSQISPDLPQLVKRHGRSLLGRFQQESARLFPRREADNGERTIAYFWSRSLRCPGCEASLSLQKRPWLSKKDGKSIFLSRIPDYANNNYARAIAVSGGPNGLSNAWHGNIIRCPFCGYLVTRDIMDATLAQYAYDELTACCTSPGRGKSFLICENTEQLIPSEQKLVEQINIDLAALGVTLPTQRLPQWS